MSTMLSSKTVANRLIYGEESGIKIRSREESHYSESKTPTARTEPRRRRGDRYSRSPSPHASVFKRLKKDRSLSPRPRPRKEGGVFNRLGRKEPATSARSDSRQRSPQAKRTEVEARRRQQKGTPSRTTSQYSESDSEGGHWKSKSRRQRSNTYEDDLSQPWTCEERNPFTPRIRNFSLPRTRMPSHVKTYDGSGDPEDHLKLFQSAAKTEGWAMPTWCHMSNSSTSPENYLQQTKHIKDPVEIHHIKQRDGESTEDFMDRYKAEVLDVEGAPECMRISGFMHGITHPGPDKNLSSWKPSEGGNKPNFKKGFKNKQRPDRKPDRFSLLTKTPKEIFALERGKFKAPPPMVTPVEKRDPNKYCEFHSDTGHSTDECMQLRKQIDEMIKAGKLSQFIKELKQNDKPKAPKKGEASGKNKPLTILMIQPWEKVAKPRITQSFSPETAISFPPLREEDGTEGPMIIEVDMAGHFLHIGESDGPPTTHLIGFSERPIGHLGYDSLTSKNGDENTLHLRWMNLHGFISQLKDGVPERNIAKHRLNIREGYSPVRQKKRGQAQERNKIGRNLEVYVDDLVIKSHTEEEIIRDITETFKTLRQINMKLNPKKCTFGMQEGMFLGYKVSTNGLRACPDKADAVLSLPSPRCIKDVQKLNGKLASLNRFLSKSAEKSLPFFKTLKNCTKKSDFQWTPEAEEAFKQMKKLIAELPTLTAPREREELIIYLAAAKEAISAVLMTDREGRQIPVYFVSRTLRGPEVNYTPMNSMVLALLSASKRLKRYFQAHTVVVITNQPIKQLLSSSEISGRMLKWKFELEGYDIQYRPRTAIKGQILADFIVERP
ncbi:reverse transcriptase domain-containing protein [Tanacetum coccineum]